jgi:hypothetical protein
MASVPTNEKLYLLVVTQAKLKYHPYPSPGASHWVHKRYQELGGRFEDSAEKTKREKRTKQAIENYKRNRLAKSGNDSRDRKDKK